MKPFLISLALLMLWSSGGRAQDGKYSEEELRLIKGMLWSREEIDKEKAREAEKEKKQPEPKETDKITKDETTLNKQGSGWVLEYDNQAPAAEKTVESPPVTASPATGGGASGVELIVGGQGKDGIAKTRDLPVAK